MMDIKEVRDDVLTLRNLHNQLLMLNQDVQFLFRTGENVDDTWAKIRKVRDDFDVIIEKYNDMEV